jgi:hypothetical protein
MKKLQLEDIKIGGEYIYNGDNDWDQCRIKITDWDFDKEHLLGGVTAESKKGVFDKGEKGLFFLHELSLPKNSPIKLNRGANGQFISNRKAKAEDTFLGVPNEIVQAARKVQNWMAQNGNGSWEFLDICSRDHASKIDQIKEILNTKMI